MSTTADHTAIDGHDTHAVDAHDEHAPHPDMYYVRIALYLALMTGAEVVLSYSDIGALFLPLLFTLMVVKFFTVVLYFMHLKFDSKWFSFFFYTGLFLAAGCFTAFLSTFQFFGGN